MQAFSQTASSPLSLYDLARASGHQLAWSLRRYFAAMLSGALIVLSTAEYDLWLCAWFALVPLMLALESTSRLGEAFRLGVLCGLVVNLWGFVWIVGLMQRFGPLTLPWSIVAHVGFSAYHALLIGSFAACLHCLRKHLTVRERPLPLTMLAPLIMVACEELFPAVFPWNLGVTQAFVLPVIQIAELLGAPGVTALLLLASGALCDLCLSGRRAQPALYATTAVIASALSFGVVRIDALEAQESKAPTLEVGVVQTNLPYSENLRDPFVAARRLKILQQESRALALDGADLIVWSETAYPYLLPRSLTKDFGEGDPMRIRQGFDTPLVLGASALETESGTTRYTNSAFFLDREGKAQVPYAKRALVPFGEKVPFDAELPWLRSLRLKAAGAFSEGRHVVTFGLATPKGLVRIAPMICLEDTLPAVGRLMAAEGPLLLASLSNDGWFGATREPMQHLALSIFRSVELRAPMIRAVHNGPSALIGASGRVLARTDRASSDIDSRPPQRLHGKLALIAAGPSVFARYGWVFAKLCAALLLLGHAVCIHRRLSLRRVGEPVR